MQRAGESVLRESFVQRVGDCERSWIDRDQRVDAWAAFVVGANAVQIVLHELMAGQLFCFECGVHLCDRRLFDLEWLGLGRERGGAQ